MENILITLIYCLTFFISIKYILTKHKDLFIDYKENETEEQYKNICDELTMLKSVYNKTKEQIKNIVRKLPFNGETWIQEFIKEDIDEHLKNWEEPEENN